MYSEVRCIEVKQSGGFMDSKIRRIYVPMTESGFYILDSIYYSACNNHNMVMASVNRSNR